GVVAGKIFGKLLLRYKENYGTAIRLVKSCCVSSCVIKKLVFYSITLVGAVGFMRAGTVRATHFYWASAASFPDTSRSRNTARAPLVVFRISFGGCRKHIPD